MTDTTDLETVPGVGYRARLRYGKGLRARFLIKLTDEAAAQHRHERLRELAEMLAAAGHSAEAPLILKKAAAVGSEAEFSEVARVAEQLCGTSPKAQSVIRKRAITFRELGEDWTKSELHRLYPDHIKKMKTADHAADRLERHVYPVIGSKRISEITLDDAQEVMRRLPKDLSQLTRRNVGQLMTRLLNIAVFPMCIIASTPIPKGFLPSKGARKALAYLYPDEDRRLLACPEVPFSFRLLWGFLTREGMREGEALSLAWRDLDLKRGRVRLDKNKTDDPRAWALEPGTHAALKLYRTHVRPGAELGDLVFLDPVGRPHTQFGLALLLRSHLVTIGLKEERPELFQSTTERRQIRVHDLRGTFVTVALANGKSETWVSDRTGHRSSQMIHNYKREARSFEEIGAGELTPLDQALPELVALRKSESDEGTDALATAVAQEVGHGVGQDFTKQHKLPASPRGFEPLLQP